MTATLHTHRELDDMLGRKWRKPAFITRPWLRWVIGLGFVAYLIAAILTIPVDWGRVYEGLDRVVHAYRSAHDHQLRAHRASAAVRGIANLLSSTPI